MTFFIPNLEPIVRTEIVRKNLGDPSRLSRLSPFHARLSSFYIEDYFCWWIFEHRYITSMSKIQEEKLLKIRKPYHVVVQMKVVGVPE